jgi:hypothetical protein
LPEGREELRQGTRNWELQAPGGMSLASTARLNVFSGELLSTLAGEFVKKCICIVVSQVSYFLQ